MSKIKELIKLFIPKKIWENLAFKKFTRKYRKFFIYDFERYSKYSAAFYQTDSPEKYLNLISVYTHILEKGLIMPDMRIGFGQIKIIGIIKICDDYINKFTEKDQRLLSCVSVIREYYNLHKKINYEFSQQFENTIQTFLNKFPNTNASKQFEFNKTDYFKDINSDFATFAKSRHSLREFEGKVDLNKLELAIELANTSPSACNRQSQKVYIIKGETAKNDLLNIHIGSGGFGHLADAFLVITYSLDYWKDFTDRNAGYFDAGMYAMNLLYALHYYEIGACILNAYFSPEQDKTFRSKIKIADNENVACIIAIGNVPEKFKIALSERIDSQSIIKYL